MNDNEIYFNKLIEEIENKNPPFYKEWQPIQDKKSNHTKKNLLEKNVYLNFVVNRGKPKTNYGIYDGLVVILLIESGPYADSYFKQLECHKQEIEKELKIKDIQWIDSTGEKRKFIYIINKVEENEWAKHIDWHIKTMTKFMEVFPSYVNELKEVEVYIENAEEGIISPYEVGEDFSEGIQKQVTMTSYERNPKARIKCIEHYGYSCSVCKLNFEDKYGFIGKNFIHVHHLIPISNIKEEYKVDGKEDLRPVCPNCHAMLHKKNPPCSIDELRKIIKINL